MIFILTALEQRPSDASPCRRTGPGRRRWSTSEGIPPERSWRPFCPWPGASSLRRSSQFGPGAPRSPPAGLPIAASPESRLSDKQDPLVLLSTLYSFQLLRRARHHAATLPLNSPSLLCRCAKGVVYSDRLLLFVKHLTVRLLTTKPRIRKGNRISGHTKRLQHFVSIFSIRCKAVLYVLHKNKILRKRTRLFIMKSLKLTNAFVVRVVL